MQQITPTAVATAAATVPPSFGTAVARNLPLLLSGLRITLELSVIALLLAIVVGVIAGLLRVVPFRPLRLLATAYVEFFRNTPLLVHTFFAYFGLPAIGIRLPGFGAAFLALGIYTGAFVAEVVRAGILAVGRGQLEAARSLGLTYLQMMRFVVLPQAFSTTIPPLGNLAIALVKNSSLASTIAVADLMYNGEIVNSRTFATYEVFGFVALVYVVLTLPMGAVVGVIERRLTRHRA